MTDVATPSPEGESQQSDYDDEVRRMWSTFHLEPDVQYVVHLRGARLEVQILDIVFETNGAPLLLTVEGTFNGLGDIPPVFAVPWNAIEFYGRSRHPRDDLEHDEPCEICGANPGEICDFETHDDYFDEQGDL